MFLPCSSPVPVLTQVHTALFASVEAGGSVQLWDLNTNTEVPAWIIIMLLSFLIIIKYNNKNNYLNTNTEVPAWIIIILLLLLLL